MKFSTTLKLWLLVVVYNVKYIYMCIIVNASGLSKPKTAVHCGQENVAVITSLFTPCACCA